jgi:chloride channel protein, CIC family
MGSIVSTAGLRLRLGYTGALKRLGFGENSFLLPVAVLIGIVTAIAAVAFHELIVWIRTVLYQSAPADVLYGKGVLLLVLFPMLGGLVVGVFSTYLMRSREGHGVVDVMETVMRSSGFIRPTSALEKILTSAVTIGSGGSAGAEGPIVQIGAGISSAFGQFFQVTRAHLPVLIGCGTAAGISAIFNAPIGGVLFTLEIILFDFSIRTFTPVVLASVVANVTTQAIFHNVLGEKQFSIFTVTPGSIAEIHMLSWPGVPAMILLGLGCGLAGVSLTRLMYLSDEWFHRLKLPRAARPAIGGMLLGALGVVYVVLFGWVMRGQAKPINFQDYPMPAFFGDGYGVVRKLIGVEFYGRDFQGSAGQLITLLAFLCLAKIVGTCLTLSSGGSGGIIAPSLFLGATTGALVGSLLQLSGHHAGIDVGFFALVGMGAVLAAVVHAPLASILILFEVTGGVAQGQQNIILPAMLACVVATGTAQLIFRDSVYTLTLRRRGVRVGSGADLSLLRRLTLEQVELEPVHSVGADDPFEKLLQLSENGASDFVVLDRNGTYAGMVIADDIKTALLQREAIPLLTVGEMVRPELAPVKNTDDLGAVLETFSRYEVARLPVALAHNPSRIIGLVSRRGLMERYHQALSAV